MIKNTKQNTPIHCHDCWNFQDCVQAQNMTADTPAVERYTETEKYVDHFCANCAPEDGGELYPLEYEELDSPTHCSICGVPLIHPLTIDGVNYLKEAINDGDGCCRELWPIIWSDYLD